MKIRIGKRWVWTVQPWQRAAYNIVSGLFAVVVGVVVGLMYVNGL